MPDPTISDHMLHQTMKFAQVANDALQTMGATGYSMESLVECCVRRCRGWMIAASSIEMIKNRIAEGVFERSFSQRPLETPAA